MNNKIQLRPLKPSDRDFFFYLYTHADVIRYVSSQKSAQEIQDAFESRLPHWTFDSTHWLCLVIEDSETHSPMGLIGFCLTSNEEYPLIADVGYMIDPRQSGKGVASAALRELLFLEDYQSIKRFSAVVTAGNDASERVLIKNGFQLDEVIEKNYEIEGVLYDDLIYLLQR